MTTAAGAKKKKSAAPSALSGAKEGRVPKTFGAQLATLVSEPPKEEGWIHELKLDGYRILAFCDGSKIQLVTRNGKDWTGALSVIVRGLAALKLKDVVLDGELVAIDEKGRSSFQRLQNALAGSQNELAYYAFDLPFAGGWDLRNTPLLERKALLESLIKNKSPIIRYSDHVEGDGARVLKQACELGAEGIISKRAGSPYQSKRTRDWLKIKCISRQEMVIGGYTDPSGARSGFGALILGVYDDDENLMYAGKVGTGFNNKMLDELYVLLKKREVAKSPFKNPPREKGLHWVKPDLVCEVAFTEWTQDGALRHPSFQGLRKDKPPKAVRRETPAH